MDDDFEDGYFPDFPEDDFPVITWKIDERLRNPPYWYKKKKKLYPPFKAFIGLRFNQLFTVYKVYGKRLTLPKKALLLTCKGMLYFIYFLALPFIIAYNLITGNRYIDPNPFS